MIINIFDKTTIKYFFYLHKDINLLLINILENTLYFSCEDVINTYNNNANIFFYNKQNKPGNSAIYIPVNKNKSNFFFTLYFMWIL